MPLSARRLLASGVNVLAVTMLSLPAFHAVEDRPSRQLIVIMAFLGYNLACEAAFGRCLGGLIAGLRWAGSPSLPRRLVFCLFYTAAFIPYVVLPVWQAIPNIAVQWLWGRFVGGTVHSWLAGVRSEIEA